MGKYGEALGIWELRIGGGKFDLKPKLGDNRKLMNLMSESKKKKDEGWMMAQMGEFVKELITRDYPPLDDTEKEELDMYIEFNITQLIEELMIAFRWTTREKLKEVTSEGILKSIEN